MKRYLFGGVFILAILEVGIANADGLPPPPEPMLATTPVFDWTGCYIGAHVGGGWGKARWIDPEPGPGQVSTDEGTDHTDGWLGGGQIGCNYQTGALVFGAEAEASWANLSGQHPNPIFAPTVLHTDIDRLGAFAGRVGYAFGRLLVYARGGGAWVHNDYAVSSPALGTFATAAEDRWGWIVGGGLELALHSHWSAKLDYSYIDLGTERIRLDCPTCAAGFFNKDLDQEMHTVRLGFNYQLNWWEPAALK